VTRKVAKFASEIAAEPRPKSCDVSRFGVNVPRKRRDMSRLTADATQVMYAALAVDLRITLDSLSFRLNVEDKVVETCRAGRELLAENPP
jgi:hypothetical protein